VLLTHEGGVGRLLQRRDPATETGYATRLPGKLIRPFIARRADSQIQTVGGAQLTIEVSNRATLPPQSFVILLAQIPVEQTFEEALLIAQLLGQLIVAEHPELRLHVAEVLPQHLLLARTERDDVFTALDRIQA
jgi:hypothetical protein